MSAEEHLMQKSYLGFTVMQQYNRSPKGQQLAFLVPLQAAQMPTKYKNCMG